MSTVKNARKASRGTGTRKAGRGANWVDFKEIKRSITMEMVLERYGLLTELKKSGQNLVGCCPIHQGSNPRQFSVDPRKNIFNCFGNCRSGGNVLDFVAKMENVPLRQAGLKLKDWFSAGSGPVSKKPIKKEPMADTEQTSAKEEVNPPLTFKLKNVVPNHPFFRESGISPDTIAYFDLGFCSRGMMKDRIVIPIHNETGELVAYSGRAVTPDQIKEEGKYKLPPKFVKSAVVYNLNRLAKNENTVFLVESFLSVFRFFKAGFNNCLALMGSQLSPRQEELIAGRLGPNGRAVLLFDHDESGQTCTKDCLARLGSTLFVKAPDISSLASKPHHLSPQQITDLFSI